MFLIVRTTLQVCSTNFEVILLYSHLPEGIMSYPVGRGREWVTFLGEFRKRGINMIDARKSDMVMIERNWILYCLTIVRGTK